MYHYVRDIVKNNYPEIKGLDLKNFKEQILYLDKNYTFVKIDDIIDAYDNNYKLPENAALLTFDDGYKDHFINVFPILNEMNIQGCFYPPASVIENNSVLDVNKIHFILASVKDKNIIIEQIFDQLTINKEKYKLQNNRYYFDKLAIASRFDSEEVIFIKRILQVELPENLRFEITDFLFKKYVTSDEASFSKTLYMNIDNMKEMIGAGMHFGSHGFGHYWLASLSRKQQEVDIKKSLNFLKKIGADLNNWTMCYPYGSYNNDTISILKNNRCQLAFTTKVSIAQIDSDDRLEVPRLDTNDLPKDRNG